MGDSAFQRFLVSASGLAGSLMSDGARERLRGWIAPLVENRVVTYREVAEWEDVRVWWFGDEEEYEFSLPEYYDELPPEIDRLIGIHDCLRPFVMEVPGVVLKGKQGFKIAEDGRYVVYNFWRDPDDPANRKDAAHGLALYLMYGLGQGTLPEFTSNRGRDPPEIDLAVPFLTRHTTNYTHWTQECLTLLEGVDEYEARTGERPVILVPPDPPSFIPESLDLLGYGDRYAEWTHDRARVRRLVLPSVRRCLSDTSEGYFRAISAFEWVRNRAWDGVSTDDGDGDYSDRILISREDAGTRRITNRDEVAGALSEMGFETYVTGEMSYREQVRLFSGAEFVVGTHGAGMVNSIYAADAAVLELYGDHYLPANYELAQGLGLDYGCLRCDPAGDDISVDVDELVGAIETLAESS